MADDNWQRRRRRDDDEDFGPPLFGDEPTGELRRGELSFNDSDTGPLPHWTEPPTGELPRMMSKDDSGDHDDLDVWSSFADNGPVWRDEPTGPADPPSGSVRRIDDTAGEARHSGAVPIIGSDGSAGLSAGGTSSGEPTPSRREPGRIQIGTDPTGGEHRPPPGGRRRSADPTGRPRRPAPSVASTRRPASSVGAGRDLPTAIVVGVALAAAFIGAAMWRKEAVLAIIVAVLGLGAYEFYSKVTERGYQPATLVGLLACVGAPLAVWWQGLEVLLFVLVLAFAATCATFIAGHDLETNPLPNTAITMLGVVWIGVLGAYGARILSAPGRFGTDTLVLVAIGVVANDTGAYFAGSIFGRRPMRAWISPNKTIEGFLGGTALTLIAMYVFHVADRSQSWTDLSKLLELGVVICITAPLGDLTESMFKRNLDIKDFGTLVRGHGGVLDRFDGFLFTLPAVYYFILVAFR